MFQELRRRNVHRVAIAYLAGAWLLVQVIETLMPAFDWSGQALRVVLILLAVGFVPAMILAWVFEWTPEGFRREAEIAAEAPRSDSRGFDRAITVVLVLAVAYFAVDKFVFDPARDEADIAVATEQATKRALSGVFLDEFRDRSVLVLPFINMSVDTEQEYFADGISEEILNVLARIEALRVISRSTSWTFKGKDVDITEVQRELDVSHVLEGSVRKAGEQVRITAQLIDARTDTHIWSETYDRELRDILAIQDEISIAVADQLHLEVFSGTSPHEGVDPRAYELYIRATANTTNNKAPPSEHLPTMRRLLLEAIKIEPDYLPALYYLAIAIEQLSRIAPADERPEFRRKVLDIVDHMERLAPESAFANNWRAYIAMNWHNDLIAAAPHLEKGMRYANRTDIHVWFNGAIALLARLKRHDEGIAIAQYMLHRDPACTDCIGALARAMRRAGRHAEALLVIESIRKRNYDDFSLWNVGVVALIAGAPEKALQYFDQLEEGSAQIDREFARAFALHSLGRREEFEAIVNRSVNMWPDTGAEGIARLYAWSNQRDEAFKWLEIMINEQGQEAAQLVKTNLYEPIKSDPRWREFLKKYGAEDMGPSNIPFNPQYPPALQRAVDAIPDRR